jgi:hypothetical protein
LNQGIKDGFHEDVQNLGQQFGVVSEAISQCVGKREHPLPDGRMGKNTIDEMGGGIGHPASATGMAYASLFARKRNEPVQSARIAVDAKKAVGKHPAFQEGAEFTFDKSWNVPIAGTLVGKECFQLSGDEAMQRIVFGIAGPIRRIGNHAG